MKKRAPQNGAVHASIAVASIVFVISLAIFIQGCLRQTAPPEPQKPLELNSEPAAVEHVVSYSGETLALIASWYTGKASNWTFIRDANPGLRPERIALGRRIFIPGRMVIERNPMPKKFVQDNFARVKSNPTPDVRPEEAPPTDEARGESGAPPADNSKEMVAEKSTATTAKQIPQADDMNLDELIGKDSNTGKAENSAAKNPSDAGLPPKPATESAPTVGKKAAPANGDAEREQLLDELLTQ